MQYYTPLNESGLTWSSEINKFSVLSYWEKNQALTDNSNDIKKKEEWKKEIKRKPLNMFRTRRHQDEMGLPQNFIMIPKSI